MILYHIQEGADQFIILHKKHAVHIFLNIGKDLIAYRFYSRTVGNGIRAVQFHHFSRVKGRRHARRLCRFDPHDFDLRVQHLGQRSYAGDQSAAAHRHQDVIHRRKFLHDLHGDRPLTGGDIRIIERMDECIALFLGQFACICIGIVIYIPVQDHFSAHALRPVYLDQRRDRRHNDHGLTAELLRRKRHALGVVPGRRCDQSPGPFFLAHGADLIVRAADLICAGMLHVLRFQIDLSSGLGA